MDIMDQKTNDVSQFDWSELDELEGDPEKNVLMGVFKQDLDKIENQDLEQGLMESTKQLQKVQPQIKEEDKVTAKKQPEFHIGNKAMPETCFFCCINHDLNRRELRYFKKFMASMIADYDRTNQKHETNLARFFKATYGKEPENGDNVENIPMIDDQWKDMGFQQRNPRTDFRGGGHLGLLCLLYFQENYTKEFDEMIGVTKDREELIWLTGISSINMTHGLMIFLYMISGNMSPSLEKYRADRQQFKMFCKLNSQCKRTFFILHCFGLRFLYHSWLQKINDIGVEQVPMAMMHFSTLLDNAKIAIGQLLAEPTLDMYKLVQRTEERIEVIKSAGGSLLPKK